MDLHKGISIRAFHFGEDRAPLLVIDNLVANPQGLVQLAQRETFTLQSHYYPGIRAEAPMEYRQLIADTLKDTIAGHFNLAGDKLQFSLCHFSLVTTPPERLLVPQRIPHVDSLGGSGLASIHYLFRRELGGTAFYRHRKTGFEYIDEARNAAYLVSLREENLRPETAGPGYINGDTPLFEQIEKQEGVFNRMLVYRRNSLHSGCIGRDFIPDPDPASGRLSINSFIDLQA